MSFYLYKRVSGVWTLVSTCNVFIDSAGLARTTWKFASAGQYYVRSQANPTTYNEIINACTTAQKIYKHPNLPLLGSDGSLPPLP